MFRNILVSIDGSAHSDRALREAIDIAELSSGRLTIITAVPRPTSWASSTVTASAARSLMADLEQESHQIMRRALDLVPASVPVTKIITYEPIRNVLSERIASANHDLLVMGSRGRGALSASVLGSVSHFALNHIKIPVLIVHTDADEAAEREPLAGAAAAGAV
jgi:nucleotide-binding universal stress UspA family protein